MDAADILFSRRGPDAVSIRDIAVTAGVNLAAVNYHFGTKENLFKQGFERAVLPCNQTRLNLLREVLDATQEGTPPPLRAILHAFYAPLFKLAYESSEKARVIVMARYLSEAFSTAESGRAVIDEFYRPIREAFIPALQQALPALPIDAIVWRYNSMAGISVYALGGLQRMSQYPSSLADKHDLFIDVDADVAIAYTLDFVEAGFSAPGSALMGSIDEK